MTQPNEVLKPGDALLIVDVQNDFCPGGALPIPDGDSIIPLINQYTDAALAAGTPIYFSRDWHPKCHVSFRENGGPWPPHCVQDTPGASFHKELRVPESAVVVTKGTRLDQDQNSAFDQTGLAFWLKNCGIKRILVAGLAQDVCVEATVLDGLSQGFSVGLIEQATLPVSSDEGEASLKRMYEAGAVPVTLES